jgi:mycothiol maleylpyruvate isomerase-like protein
MDDPRDMHRRAGDLAGKVISQITRPQLGLPTPCAKWDVKDLIAHTVTAQRRFAAKLSCELEPDEGGDSSAIIQPRTSVPRSQR